MHAVLYQYDIYPKVFLGDTQQAITIQPYGGRESFVAGKTYWLKIYKVNQSIKSKSLPRTEPMQ